jgi:hypothetical protein
LPEFKHHEQDLRFGYGNAKKVLVLLQLPEVIITVSHADWVMVGEDLSFVYT